ncbi:MAG: hypothetical protein AAB682_02030 [Patescibacteria group bacterium]
MARYPISITLEGENNRFLTQTAVRLGRTKSSLVDTLLTSYRKQVLARTIRAGFSSQKKEDLELAMSDLATYRDLVEKSA